MVGEYKGPELVGMEYEQLLPWVKPIEVDEQGAWHDASAKAFRVIPGDYVTTEDGTGIVHIAPDVRCRRRQRGPRSRHSVALHAHAQG